MNDFIITRKVFFKTLATQSTKHDNPMHTQTEAQPKQPQKMPREGQHEYQKKSQYWRNPSTPKEDKKNTIPTRDLQGPKIHSQNYNLYLFYNKTNSSEICPPE